MSHDSRYHPEWETVSRYVRELFNYHCSRCSKDCRQTKNSQMVLQVHHIDENPATPQKYGVRGIPTLMIFRDGNLVDTKVGSLPKNMLESWLDPNL